MATGILICLTIGRLIYEHYTYKKAQRESKRILREKYGIYD